MAGGLVLGTIVSLIHHFYYRYLDGRIVENSNQQAWFLRIGTGLAFITKALLTASAAIAYTQLLWRTLRSRPVTLSGIDSLFDVVHSAFSFTDLELWAKGPLLAVVALTIWYDIVC
jgi:hypothetical protein